MLRDIRELSAQQEEYAAELSRRWGGLLSYRYFGRNHGSIRSSSCNSRMLVLEIKFRSNEPVLGGGTGRLVFESIMPDEVEGRAEANESQQLVHGPAPAQCVAAREDGRHQRCHLWIPGRVRQAGSRRHPPRRQRAARLLHDFAHQPQARNHARQIWETPLIAGSHGLRPLEPPEAYKVVPRRVRGLDGQIRSR